jgi:hypothetical protein
LNMNRPLRTVLLGTVIVAVVGGLAYFCAMRLCARQMAADDLAWLKHEFRLSDAELQRVRQLHAGYLPKCQEMCSRIAEKQSEVETALGRGESPDKQLLELAALRAQCQAQMLRHFQEVSQAMPPDQGKRYLSEMQKLTLGSHQDIERSMGGTPASGHMHGNN